MNSIFQKIGVGLGLCTALAPQACTAQKTVEKPNILFILLDDMGKEWTGFCGAEDIKTPNIDLLAKQGVVFENMYSMPQCTPSRVSLLTGQYPWNHGWVNHYDVPRWGHGVRFDPQQNKSFPAYLEEESYTTCAAGKWQINDFRIEPEILKEVGFDDYCMWTGYEANNAPSQKRYWDPYIHTKEGSRTYPGEYSEDIFSDFVIDFMKENKNNPFMAYYAMCLPHGPVEPTPNEPNAKTKMEKHKAMVRYADFILGKLVKSLDDLGIRENTIIVWTTDNGTAGVVGHRNGRQVRGGKTLLTENGINSPFIINCPAKFKPQVVSQVADFTDMLPTFVDMANGETSKKKLDGVSLLPLLYGKKANKKEITAAIGSRHAFIENGRVRNTFNFRDRVLRTENYKVFVDSLRTIHALYDIRVDVEEANNLINSKQKEHVKVLKKFASKLKSLPLKDAVPNYTAGENQTWDIDTLELKKISLKQKMAPNRRPAGKL